MKDAPDTALDYLPLFLRLKNKSCLLVGAGAVAARKAHTLLRAGARVTVVAPAAGVGITELAGAGRLTLNVASFREDFLNDVHLVIAATGDVIVNRQVADLAAARGIFCNSVDDVENSTAIMPAIVDRSPLIVAISTSGNAPVLARRWREAIEALLPARTGSLVRRVGRWRQQVAQRIPDARLRMRFWERLFDEPLAARVLAGDEGDFEKDFAAALADRELDAAAAAGEGYLVGAGPGDPGLLTIRALQLMQQADVVLYDRLVSDEILALTRRDAERIAVGKRAGAHCMEQEDINALLVRLVAEGNKVCRLKGGDPFVFGRGGEEIAALRKAGLPFQIVPGITAAAGCAAYAGMPLTHRDFAQSVVLVTAHGRDSIDIVDWQSLAHGHQTLAIYMGVGRIAEIRRQLLLHGRAARTPFAIVERGTTPQQRVITGELATLVEVAARERVQAPAMLYIGEVAAFARDFGWFGNNAARALQDSEIKFAHG